MWSLWLIVGVAVASAVTLTVSGVLVAVQFERRRHRNLTTDQNLDRSLSQHYRAHLSITDVDFSSLPRPVRSLRQSFQRPRSESSRFYASCSSQDGIKTFPEGTLMDSVVEPGWTVLGPSHQWLTPSKSNKRKKKVQRLSVSGPIATTRLSAVTEVSEGTRQATPEPVELPTNTTPRLTPEKALEARSTHPLPSLAHTHYMQSSNNSGLTTFTDELGDIGSRHVTYGTAVRSRSISTGSIATPPPDMPLPEMPSHPATEQRRDGGLKRSKSSEFRKHRRELSMISPTLTTTQTNQVGRVSGMSKFEFGLKESDRTTPKARAEVPSLYIDTNSTTLQPYGQKSLCMPHSAPATNAPYDDFKTIDASKWNIPRGLRHLGSTTPTRPRNNLESSSRPVSGFNQDGTFMTADSADSTSLKEIDIASARPISITSVDMFRLSVVDTALGDSPRRGHKRQNCVRIKNLHPADTRKRLSSQLDRLAEAEEENSSILLPSPAKKRFEGETSLKETTQNASRVRQPPSLSLRVKRPGLVDNKLVQEQNVPLREDAPQPATLALSSPESTPRNVQKITSIDRDTESHNNTTLPNTNPSSHSNDLPISAGPTSASQYDTQNPKRQKSKIQGPRSIPPPSLRARTHSVGSPIKRKSSASSSKTNRKTSAFLKSIPTNPETTTTPTLNTIQQPTTPTHRKRSHTIAGHTTTDTSTPPQHSLPDPQSLPRQKPRTYHAATTTPTPTPNRFQFQFQPHSSPAISIWEDVSINAESPDSTAAQLHAYSGSYKNTNSNMNTNTYSPWRDTPKSRRTSAIIARFEGIENAQRKDRDRDRSGDRDRSVGVSVGLELSDGSGYGYGTGRVSNGTPRKRSNSTAVAVGANAATNANGNRNSIPGLGMEEGGVGVGLRFGEGGRDEGGRLLR